VIATRFVTQSFMGRLWLWGITVVLTEDHPFGPRGRSAGLERTIAAMRFAEDQVLNSPDLQQPPSQRGTRRDPGRASYREGLRLTREQYERLPD
jgi:hypothetical protein